MLEKLLPERAPPPEDNEEYEEVDLHPYHSSRQSGHAADDEEMDHGDGGGMQCRTQ